ncbi:MAG: diguanylate cyclase [Holophagaceae bacterium]|nr:diguanylate cyclase [Holophagaceae bacterium]
MADPGTTPTPTTDAYTASQAFASRLRVDALLRRMDLSWPDLTRPPQDRLLDLMLDVEGAALAAEGQNPALALAARDLHHWLQGLHESARELSTEMQLEIVDAIVRLRIAADLGPKAPPIAPMPRITILAPIGGVDIQLGQAFLAGYQIELFSEPDDLLHSVREEPPDLVVLDLDAPFGPEDLPVFLARLQEGQGRCLPVSYLSLYTDLEARLTGVRASGVAFFAKPMDLQALLDAVDRLDQPQLHEPIRVLVVEDDPLTAAFCTRILEGGGMRVAVVRDPLAIMQPLVEHRPDALLMDLYMPDCSGLELAAVIRQQEAYVGLPIIFLSGEQQLERQLEALSLGAEDFLTKPVSPRHLLSIVTTRATRGRQLRNLLVRDSLTGLLNHVHLKDKLRLETARAARVEGPLSFAMLDLDRFKLVNDTYGHAAGDRVLKNLSRLLQQRLRKTDVIGRWGGEEFAVVLPDTPLPVAVKVMEDIRERFAQLPQELGRKSVRLTLSCGVAAFPQFDDVPSLVDAADQALYAAKGLGRNRTLASDRCDEPGSGIPRAPGP